jgi:hypothetical protein
VPKSRLAEKSGGSNEEVREVWQNMWFMLV